MLSRCWPSCMGSDVALRQASITHLLSEPASTKQRCCHMIQSSSTALLLGWPPSKLGGPKLCGGFGAKRTSARQSAVHRLSTWGGWSEVRSRPGRKVACLACLARLGSMSSPLEVAISGLPRASRRRRQPDGFFETDGPEVTIRPYSGTFKTMDATLTMVSPRARKCGVESTTLGHTSIRLHMERWFTRSPHGADDGSRCPKLWADLLPVTSWHRP